MRVALGLSSKDASRICMQQCQAMCCRGPQILQLSPEELAAFRRHADALRVTLKAREATDGSGQVLFLEHEGEHCPMLNGRTSACRIYADRPSRCRQFPDRPTPGCAISGADEAALQ